MARWAFVVVDSAIDLRDGPLGTASDLQIIRFRQMVTHTIDLIFLPISTFKLDPVTHLFWAFLQTKFNYRITITIELLSEIYAWTKVLIWLIWNILHWRLNSILKWSRKKLIVHNWLFCLKVKMFQVHFLFLVIVFILALIDLFILFNVWVLKQ